VPPFTAFQKEVRGKDQHKKKCSENKQTRNYIYWDIFLLSTVNSRRIAFFNIASSH
jgi:hypothetical protein